MDKAQALNLARLYASEVIKEMRPERIVLYGSHAAGQAQAESDIDVAVIFNGFTGDRHRIFTRLWTLTRRVSSFLEPILLDRADDKSGFAEEILRTGEIIYQRNVQGNEL